MSKGLLLRRIGVRSRTRSLEGIAAVLDLALKVSGRATGAAEVLEPVVVRLEFLVSDAPVLDGHVGRQKLRAVALQQVRAQHEVRRQESPGLRVPVHATAA